MAGRGGRESSRWGGRGASLRGVQDWKELTRAPKTAKFPQSYCVPPRLPSTAWPMTPMPVYPLPKSPLFPNPEGKAGVPTPGASPSGGVGEMLSPPPWLRALSWGDMVGDSSM